MKTIRIFIVAFLLCNNLFAQSEGFQKSIKGLELYTLKDCNFRGPVKMVKAEHSRWDVDAYIDEGYTILYFDVSGKLTAEERKTIFMGMDFGTYKDTYSYDNAGRLMNIETRDESLKKSTTTFTYDGKGNPVSEESTLAGRVPKIIYEYDAKNRLSLKKEFYANQTVPYKTVAFTYDDQGRIISSTDEDVLKKTKEKFLYTYLPGQLGFSTKKSESGKAAAITDIVSYANEYNDKGDVLVHNCIDSEGKPNRFSNRYSYEYDKAGNWTKQNTSGSDEGYSLRTITYHGEPDENSPAGVYRKAIQEGIGPTLKEIGFFFQSALQKTLTKEQLQKNITHLDSTVAADKKYVQSIKEISGDKAKFIAIELLDFIGSVKVQNDLQSLANDAAKNSALVGIDGEQIASKIAAINSELQKLK